MRSPPDKLLHSAAGWIAAGAGFLAVIVITALTSSPANALGAGLLFVGLLAGSFASIVVHELGHALAAWAVGWRVWIISALPVIVRLGHAPRFSPKLSQDVGGYVLGSPPSGARDQRWRSIVFTAGGPLASLLTGPLFIYWLTTLPREGWETPTGAGLLGAGLAFGFYGAYSAAVTLWPWRTKSGRPNDMLMILGDLASKDAPQESRAAAWAVTLFEHGVEPGAWPAWVRESTRRAAPSPWSLPHASVLAFVCALDEGDASRARAVAERAPNDVGKILRAFVAAHFDADKANADAALASVSAEPDSDALTWFRALAIARVLQIEGDTAAAERAYKRLAEEITASGPPHPFWELLLSRTRTTLVNSH